MVAQFGRSLNALIETEPLFSSARGGGRAWLEETVGEQIGEAYEGLPAGGGVRESAVEAAIEN